MKNIFLTITILLCVIGFSGCDADNDNKCYPLTKWVGGKWKLVKMRVVTTNPDYDNGWSKTETTDYSKDSIIYDFQYEENYEYTDKYWTPKWKLIVHNYIPTGLPNDIQESGEYFYQFRQPRVWCESDYGYVMPPEDGHNLVIDIDTKYTFDCFGFANGIYDMDIKASTDTISIGTYRYGNFYDKDSNHIHWEKYFVRIKDGEQ